MHTPDIPKTKRLHSYLAQTQNLSLQRHSPSLFGHLSADSSKSMSNVSILRNSLSKSSFHSSLLLIPSSYKMCLTSLCTFRRWSEFNFSRSTLSHQASPRHSDGLVLDSPSADTCLVERLFPDLSRLPAAYCFNSSSSIIDWDTAPAVSRTSIGDTQPLHPSLPRSVFAIPALTVIYEYISYDVICQYIYENLELLRDSDRFHSFVLICFSQKIKIQIYR